MEEGQFVISSDCFHQSPPLYTFFQVLLMFALTSLRPNTVQKGLLKGLDIEKPKIEKPRIEIFRIEIPSSENVGGFDVPGFWCVGQNTPILR